MVTEYTSIKGFSPFDVIIEAMFMKGWQRNGLPGRAKGSVFWIQSMKRVIQ